MLIEKKSALKAYYYLMSVDGVTTFEEDLFMELGSELLADEFYDIKDQLIEECESVINSALVDDERYDVIQEGLDVALSAKVFRIAEGIMPRLLVWNMLSLACSDDDFSDNENRLISHVVRMLNIDKSVYAEMKQLISTYAATEKQLSVLNESNRPYVEIKPLVDEIDKRRITIVEAVKALIEDDVFEEEPEKKENVIVGMGKKVGNAVSSGGKKIGENIVPVAQNIGGKAQQTLKNASTAVGETASKGATGIKEGAGKLFAKMKDVTKKKSDGGK